MSFSTFILEPSGDLYHNYEVSILQIRSFKILIKLTLVIVSSYWTSVSLKVQLSILWFPYLMYFNNLNFDIFKSLNNLSIITQFEIFYLSLSIIIKWNVPCIEMWHSHQLSPWESFFFPVCQDCHCAVLKLQMISGSFLLDWNSHCFLLPMGLRLFLWEDTYMCRENNKNGKLRI